MYTKSSSQQTKEYGCILEMNILNHVGSGRHLTSTCEENGGANPPLVHFRSRTVGCVIVNNAHSGGYRRLVPSPTITVGESSYLSRFDSYDHHLSFIVKLLTLIRELMKEMKHIREFMHQQMRNQTPSQKAEAYKDDWERQDSHINLFRWYNAISSQLHLRWGCIKSDN